MSKAVLIIDMPDNCMECDLTWNDSDNGKCCPFIGELDGQYVDGKWENYHYLEKHCHKNCPLKPYKELIPIEFVEKIIGEYDDWNENIEPLIDLIKRWEKEKENG